MRKLTWTLSTAALLLLTACGKPEDGQMPEAPPAPPPAVKALDAPPSEPTSPVPDADMTGARTSPADVAAPEVTPPAPLGTIDDPGLRAVETARRAVVAARSAVAAKSYAELAEHCDAAVAALEVARGSVAAEQKPRVERLLASLRQYPGTPAEADAVLAQFAPFGPAAGHEPIADEAPAADEAPQADEPPAPTQADEAVIEDEATPS